jgi:predicted P-loop ATPase
MSAPRPSTGPDWAISAGLSVIPLGPNKRPMIESWKAYQNRQPTAKEISEWKNLRPPVWALVTGKNARLITLDFDGKTGAATMQKLGIQPHLQTPSGGYHAYVEHPGMGVEVKTRNDKVSRELHAKWPGLDPRGDGGYSAFCGRTGKGEYTLLRDPIPYPFDFLPRGRVTTDRMLRMALDRVAMSGRNNAGFWLAGQLRDNGYSQSEADPVMRNYRSRVPPENTKGHAELYTEAEMLATLNEVYKWPPREPWNSESTHQAPRAAAVAMPELIKTDRGIPRAVLANAITALRGPDFEGVLAFDEFRQEVVTLKSPPWGGHAAPWLDHQDRLTTNWLQHRGVYVCVEVAGQAVQVVARDRPFHPVRRYLDSLKWDGTRRIDSWLSLYLGAEDSHYAAAVGARWLISGVARIYQPGTKVDCCPILEGRQGLGKSRALRTLAGDWFTDEIGDLGSKDAAMQSRGVWIVELSELGSMDRSGSETSRIKAFISRSTDRFRPPYGKHLIECPRQCIFAGSVNKSTYLKDETGARRFWPVACTRILIPELKRDRDQLWAEAVEHYGAGAVWWMETIELNRLAEKEQTARYETDPWDEAITSFIVKKEDVSIPEILRKCLGKKKEHWTQLDQNRIAKVLTSHGWVKYRRSVEPRDWRYRLAQLNLGI